MQQTLYPLSERIEDNNVTTNAGHMEAHSLARVASFATIQSDRPRTAPGISESHTGMEHPVGHAFQCEEVQYSDNLPQYTFQQVLSAGQYCTGRSQCMHLLGHH